MSTQEDRAREWTHTKNNRIASFCGPGVEPTPDQIKIAEDEADEHIADLALAGE